MANSISISPDYKYTVIDTHVHPIRSLMTETSLINEIRKAGINKAVLLALDLDVEAITKDEKLKYEIINNLLEYSMFIDAFKLIKAMEQILRMGMTSNSLVADIVRANPQFFIGFGSVNPSKDPDYVKEKLLEIEKLGLKGIKLIPTLQFFNPEKNKNIKFIFKYARERDWPILIHAGGDPGPFEIPTLKCVKDSHPKNWRKHVRKTKNKIIFAHLGCYGRINNGSWFSETTDLAKRNPNIYLDTSAVTYHLEDPDIVDQIRQTCGFGRILFGTDTPVVQGTSMKHSLEVIKNSPVLSVKEKRLILGENAKALLKIED
ncbi:MAG: amidohydrolase family protein [Candidatus Heimdallarchaeota archaeon]